MSTATVFHEVERQLLMGDENAVSGINRDPKRTIAKYHSEHPQPPLYDFLII